MALLGSAALHVIVYNVCSNGLCIMKASDVQIDKLCETKGMDYIDREKAK